MKKYILLILPLTVLFFSCTKDTATEECLTECAECEYELPDIEDDILPPIEAPRREDPQVIVLLYHNLVYGRTGNIYNRDIYNFEHDLDYIRKNFKVIDFNDLEKVNNGEMKLTQDAAVITFDDGDMSIYHLAFPLLRKYDLKATFFIVSSYIGEVVYVSWDQISEMAEYTNPTGTSLFSIGSHTATHKALGDLPLDEVEKELNESKQIIDTEANVNVEYLALPFGSGADNEEIQQLAVEAGYKGIRTSVPVSIAEYPFNMYSLPGINIENYSHDDFIVYIEELLGRD